MATAYECDRCKLTFIGEAKGMSDIGIPGTAFTLRFSFGMARTAEEKAQLEQEAEEQVSALRRLIGVGNVNKDGIENVAADLCDPCRAALLKEAVELSGLELHQ